MPSESLVLTHVSDALWTVTGGTKTAAIASDDADTSYVEGSSSDAIKYSAADSGIGAGDTIDSVVLTIKSKSLISSTPIGFRITVDNFVSVQSEAPSLTTTYATFTYTLTSAPVAKAWTLAFLNALQIAVDAADTVTCRVTYMTVTVNYTVATGSKKLLLVGVG